MKSRNLVKIVTTVVGIVIALFFVVLVVSDPDQDIVAQSPLLGQPAPAVASETIDGDQFVLERRKGSWVVLNFFNSTCVPCINEHDLLIEFANSEATNPNAAEIYTIINGLVRLRITGELSRGLLTEQVNKLRDGFSS